MVQRPLWWDRPRFPSSIHVRVHPGSNHDFAAPAAGLLSSSACPGPLPAHVQSGFCTYWPCDIRRSGTSRCRFGQCQIETEGHAQGTNKRRRARRAGPPTYLDNKKRGAGPCSPPAAAQTGPGAARFMRGCTRTRLIKIFAFLVEKWFFSADRKFPSYTPTLKTLPLSGLAGLQLQKRHVHCVAACRA